MLAGTRFQKFKNARFSRLAPGGKVFPLCDDAPPLEKWCGLLCPASSVLTGINISLNILLKEIY
jgi:hypothetical protein